MSYLLQVCARAVRALRLLLSDVHLPFPLASAYTLASAPAHNVTPTPNLELQGRQFGIHCSGSEMTMEFAHVTTRRRFLATASLQALAAPALLGRPPGRPNVLFILADEWRAQATGYNGDPNVRTPALDRLASQSVNFHNAVSGTPVCCPYRASLLTGQHPLTHGVFINDVELKPTSTTWGEASRARAIGPGSSASGMFTAVPTGSTAAASPTSRRKSGSVLPTGKPARALTGTTTL